MKYKYPHGIVGPLKDKKKIKIIQENTHVQKQVT